MFSCYYSAMIAVVGNKKQEISKIELNELIKNFEKVILDMGTGDGRFIYKNALKSPTNLYIGLDPAEKQLEIYSKEANKKRLKNSLFVVGSIENIPNELSFIDKVYVNLPWGTLLKKMVKVESQVMENLHNLLKNDGEMEVIFGYVPELEPSETERLELPKIEEASDIAQIFSSFKEHFSIVEMRKLSKKDLGNLETTWAKKLKFGRDRNIYKIILEKQGE